MCLESRETTKELDSTSGVGWKVFVPFFDGFQKGLKSWFILSLPKILREGVWLKASIYFLKFKETNALVNKHYVSGFHIFKTRKEARAWSKMTSRGSWSTEGPPFEIRKVKYRGGRLEGEQEGLRVIVADEMLITEIRG